ncbi:MAG: ADP-ribose pyrophosphatase [Gammaproteobacteria bacterium]|nr:ADP-ribose pyrophosphatase [Gammaproteobacteria bacterium]
MKFCSHCGSQVISKIPPDDDRPRYVCIVCETIHYQNPRVVTGCIPEHDGRILLCKRAIEPRRGYWTLPAGFMELGETSFEAALRETLEEANARVELLELYAVFNLPHVDQVYMMYRSKLLDLDFSPGKESVAVDLFAEHLIPWDDLAFATIRQTLKFYFQDRQSGHFRLHTGDIIKQGERYDFRDGPSGET